MRLYGYRREGHPALAEWEDGRIAPLPGWSELPGDVLATGTPSGVGVFREPPVFLEPGDRVRCEIDGIGSVENPIVDWSAAAH